MKKLTLILIAFLAIAFTSNSQVLQKLPTTVIATEEWNEIMDNSSTNYFSHIFEKNSEGVITTTTKSWQQVHGGITTMDSTPRTGLVTFDGTSLSFSVQGTATITSPMTMAGSTSPYTLSIAGIGSRNTATGTYTMSFTNTQWPGPQQGTWTGTKISGSGVTSEQSGISDVKSNNLYLYPNPATDGFYIGLDGKNANVSIFNMNGMLVLSTTAVDKAFINISALTRSMYIVKITTDERTIERKLVKK